MSCIYLAAAPEPDGVGLAVFKSSAFFSAAGDGVFGLGLGKGTLLRTGYVHNPSRSSADGGAFAQVMAVREWFRAGPCVGGACVPEEFVAGSDGARDFQALLCALMAESLFEKTLVPKPSYFSTRTEQEILANVNRCLSADESALGKLMSRALKNERLFVVDGPVSEGYGGPHTKEETLAHLSEAPLLDFDSECSERTAALHDPAPAVVEAITLGLLYLGRWKS